jgi:hypothetical protein
MVHGHDSPPASVASHQRHGVLIPFRPRPNPRTDAELNAQWDRLMQLAGEACAWRDLDSLTAIEDCLVQLRSRVERDWS